MPNPTKPDASVVIPVYDDYARLEGCLEALQRQTVAGDRLEIVVVDNGTPTDSVVAVEEQFENVRRTVEQKQGSYAARNAGIEAASGDVLAFTDADCLPEPSWLEAGLSALSSAENVGLAGGPVEVFPEDEDAPTSAEIWELRQGFPQRHYIEELNFSVTANMFTRRSVFEEVGPFADELKSGGDREFGERVAAAGYRQVFAPDAVVRHPARHRISDLLQKMVRTTRGDFRRRERNGEFTPLRRALRMLRAAADLSIGPLRAAWIAAAADGPLREGLRFAAADGLVRATRELVALEQLGVRLTE